MSQGQKVAVPVNKATQQKNNGNQTPDNLSLGTPSDNRRGESALKDGIGLISSGQGMPQMPVLAYTVQAKKALADSYSKSSRSNRNKTEDSRGKQILPWLAQPSVDGDGSFVNSKSASRSRNRNSNNADMMHVIPNAVLEAVNETSLLKNIEINKKSRKNTKVDLPRIQPSVVNVELESRSGPTLSQAGTFNNDNRTPNIKDLIKISKNSPPALDMTLSKHSLEQDGEEPDSSAFKGIKTSVLQTDIIKLHDENINLRQGSSSATNYQEQSSKQASGLRVHLKSGAAQCSTNKRSAHRRFSQSTGRNSSQLYQHTTVNVQMKMGTKPSVIHERSNEQLFEDDNDQESLISLPQQQHFMTTIPTRNASVSISRTRTKGSIPTSAHQLELMYERQKKQKIADAQSLKQLNEKQIAQILMATNGHLNTPISQADAVGVSTPLNLILNQQAKMNSRNRIEFSEQRDETEDHEPFRPLKPICLSPPRNVETTVIKKQFEQTVFGRSQFSSKKVKNLSSPRKRSIKTENRYYKLVTPTLYDNELVLNKLAQIETEEERNCRTLHNGMIIKQKHIHVMRGIDNSGDKRNNSKEKVVSKVPQPKRDEGENIKQSDRCVTETHNYFALFPTSVESRATQEPNILHDSNSLVDSDEQRESPKTAHRILGQLSPSAQVSKSKLHTEDDQNYLNGSTHQLMKAHGVQQARLINRTMASLNPLSKGSVHGEQSAPQIKNVTNAIKKKSHLDVSHAHNYVLDAGFGNYGATSATETTHSNQASHGAYLKTKLTAADLKGQFLPDENINRSKLQLNQQLVKRFGAGSNEVLMFGHHLSPNALTSMGRAQKQQQSTHQKEFIASMICGIGASMSVKQTLPGPSSSKYTKSKGMKATSTQHTNDIINHDLAAGPSGSFYSLDEQTVAEKKTQPSKKESNYNMKVESHYNLSLKQSKDAQIRESIVTATKSAMRIYESQSKDLPTISPNLSVYVKQLEAKFDERTNRKQNMIKMGQGHQNNGRKDLASINKMKTIHDSFSEIANHQQINTNIITELQTLMNQSAHTSSKERNVRMSSLQKPDQTTQKFPSVSRSPKTGTLNLLMSQSELQQRHRKFLGPMSPKLMTIGIGTQSKTSGGMLPSQSKLQGSEDANQTSDSQTLPNALTAMLNTSLNRGMMQENQPSQKKLQRDNSNNPINTVVSKLSPWPLRPQQLDQGPSSRVQLLDEAYHNKSGLPTLALPSGEKLQELSERSAANQSSERSRKNQHDAMQVIEEREDVIQISKQMNLQKRVKPSKYPEMMPIVEKADGATMADSQYKSFKVPLRGQNSSMNVTHCSSKTLYQQMPRFQGKNKVPFDSDKKQNKQKWHSKIVADTGTMRTPDPDRNSNEQPRNATSSVVTPRDENEAGGSEGPYRRHLSPSRSEDDLADSAPNDDRVGSVTDSRRDYLINTHTGRKRVEIKATHELMQMDTQESPQLTEEELVQLRLRRLRPNEGLADYMTKVITSVSPQGHYISNPKMNSMSPARKKNSLLDTCVVQENSVESIEDKKTGVAKTNPMTTKRSSLKPDPGNVRYKARSPRDAGKPVDRSPPMRIEHGKTTQKLPSPLKYKNQRPMPIDKPSASSIESFNYTGQNFNFNLPNAASAAKSLLYQQDKGSPTGLTARLNQTLQRQYYYDGTHNMSNTMDGFYQAIKDRKNSDVIVRQIREQAVNQALLSPQLVVMPPFLHKRHTTTLTSIKSKLGKGKNLDLALNNDSQDEEDAKQNAIKVRAFNESQQKWVSMRPVKDASQMRTSRNMLSPGTEYPGQQGRHLPSGFLDNRNTFNAGGVQKQINHLPMQRAAGVIDGVHKSHMVDTSTLVNHPLPAATGKGRMVDSSCQVHHAQWPASPSTTRVNSKMDPTAVTSPLNRFPVVSFAGSSTKQRNSGLRTIHQHLLSNQSMPLGNIPKSLRIDQQETEMLKTIHQEVHPAQPTSSVSNLCSNENDRTNDEPLTTLADFREKSMSGSMLTKQLKSHQNSKVVIKD